MSSGIGKVFSVSQRCAGRVHIDMNGILISIGIGKEVLLKI